MAEQAAAPQQEAPKLITCSSQYNGHGGVLEIDILCPCSVPRAAVWKEEPPCCRDTGVGDTESLKRNDIDGDEVKPADSRGLGAKTGSCAPLTSRRNPWRLLASS